MITGLQEVVHKIQQFVRIQGVKKATFYLICIVNITHSMDWLFRVLLTITSSLSVE